MSFQQLSNCNIAVGGSYTNNVVSLNLVTHAYYERATRTFSRIARFSPLESISNLLLEAERLQRTAKELSRQLKLITRFECEDLATTIDEIANETIPHVFRFSLNDHQSDMHCQRQILIEIACMQEILDKFASKSATDRRHPFAIPVINDLPFETQYLILMIRKSLSTSRDKIYVLLFKSMASSLGKRVRCHQIDIDDFFGTQWSLPQDLCLNREAFFSILRFKFQGGPAELVVASEQFGVFRQDGLQAIQAADWENVIKEGDGLQLSVFVNRSSEDMADNSNVPECPQCGQSDKTVSGGSSDGWVTCLRCDSNFNVTCTDSELNTAGQPSYSSMFRCFSVTFTRAHQPPINSGETMQDSQQHQTGMIDTEPQVAQQLQPGADQRPRRLTPQELVQRAEIIRMSMNSMEDAYHKISQGMAPGPEKDIRLQSLVRDISVRKEALEQMQRALTLMAQNGGQLPPRSPRLYTQATEPSSMFRLISCANRIPPYDPFILPPNQLGIVPPPHSGPTPYQQAPHPPNGPPGGPNNAIAGTPNPFGQMSQSMGQMFSFNNSAPNAPPFAHGVPQISSNWPSMGGAWPPTASYRQGFDSAYSAMSCIKETRLTNIQPPPPFAAKADSAGFNATSPNTGKRSQEEDLSPHPFTSKDDADASTSSSTLTHNPSPPPRKRMRTNRMGFP